MGRRWLRRAGRGVLGAGAATLYASFVADWALRGSAGLDRVVSELAVPGEPHAHLYQAGDLGCAALVLALLPGLRAGLPAGRWRDVVVAGTAVFAGGAATAAVVPTAGQDRPGPVRAGASRWAADLHDGASVVSDAGLFLGVAATWCSTRRGGPRWLHRVAWWHFWLGGVGTSAVFGAAQAAGVSGRPLGLSQRLHIAAISLWLVCLGLVPTPSKGRPG